MSARRSHEPEGQGERGDGLVLIKGDPDCDHVLIYHGMSSREGVAFAEYECVKCGRVVAQRIGQAETPDTARTAGEIDAPQRRS